MRCARSMRAPEPASSVARRRCDGTPEWPIQAIAPTHLFLYGPDMKNPAHPDTVLIVDFGSQVTQLIVRRVREAGVYSEIVPFNAAEGAFRRIEPKAVILSGSPHSTVDIGSPRGVEGND